MQQPMNEGADARTERFAQGDGVTKLTMIDCIPVSINILIETGCMLDLTIIGVINIHTTLTTSLKRGIVNPISEYSEKFSGSALHIALNASILKAQVGLIAPVGRDAVGLLDLLKRYSIDYSHIVLSSKKNPNFMELHTSHRNYDLYYEGAVSDLHGEIEKEYLIKAKAVHLCFPHQEVTDNVAKTLRKEKTVTSVDARFSQTDAEIVFSEANGKKKNTVVIGEEKELYRDTFVADNINWIDREEITRSIKVKAKIRYRNPETGARLYPLDGSRVRVEFEKPQRAITPGQAVVFYNRETVIGGGWIAG